MTVQYHPETGERGIEWTDETRNPIGGCKHGCRWFMPDGTEAICYAEEIAESGVAKRAYPHGFAHHYFRPDALQQLARGNDPLLIFADSMSDMFAPNVPEDQIHQMLDKMREGRHHSYQSLTKAAPQLLKYTARMPPNLWVGVSSPPDFFMGHQLTPKNQEATLRKSLDVLRDVKQRTGNIVWMSAEPVSWDLTSVIDVTHGLDWIVIGAASNGRQDFQPDPEHIRRLLNIMDAVDTPVFFKGNIQPLFEKHDFGSARLNRWREDFPTLYSDGSSIPAVTRRQELCAKFGWTKIDREYPLPRWTEVATTTTGTSARLDKKGA